VIQWLYTGFWLVIGLTELLRPVTTSNYKRFTNSRTLHFTRAHSWVFSACCVFTSLLITTSNSGRSPSSGFRTVPGHRCSKSRITKSLTNQLTPVHWLTEMSAYIISARTAQEISLLDCSIWELSYKGLWLVVCFEMLRNNRSSCHNIEPLILIGTRISNK
jgi:hypothetical protein